MEKKPSLKELKEILAARGLKPTNYTHLSYEELRKLAGVGN